MRAFLQQQIIAFVLFAQAVIEDFAAWLMRDPRTTGAGLLAGVAYLGARYNIILPAGSENLIVVLALIILGKLAKDCHNDKDK